jgi:hypothetical protein
VALELAKAISFLLTVLSLLSVLLTGFFEPNATWQDRMVHGLVRLAIAACVSLGSGLLFTWPVKSNPDAGEAIVSTLPVKVFLWAALGMAALFAAAWYLRCGGQNAFGIRRDCF